MNHNQNINRDNSQNNTKARRHLQRLEVVLGAVVLVDQLPHILPQLLHSAPRTSKQAEQAEVISRRAKKRAGKGKRADAHLASVSLCSLTFCLYSSSTCCLSASTISALRKCDAFVLRLLL